MSARDPAAAAPRVLVVVPTTGGPLLLRRLAPRPGLPHPAAFADGHYRPLALSADYRALAGPEGPVARHLGLAPPPHELRLSGEPDGGRSWEAPVTLAHLLLAGGAALAAEAEEADLLLWATGAVDLDLRLLPGDYALPRKVEACRALLEAQGGRRAVAVLPPGPGRGEAAAALAALRRAVPVEVVVADAADEALARLTAAPKAAKAPARRPPSRRAAPSGRGAATVAAAVAAWLLSAVANGPDKAVEAGLVAAVGAPDLVGPEPLAPGHQPARTPGAPEGPQASPAPEPPGDAPAMAVLIEEVRAAPGASCRAALFNPDLRVLRPAPRSGEGYAALPLDPLLCGVALRPAAAGAALGAVTASPPGAFVAAPSADGAPVLFLSGAPRDVVYAVPVVRGNDSPVTVEHRLVAPPTPPASPPDAPTE